MSSAWLTLALSIIGLWLLLAPTTRAQSTPTATPVHISVAGVQGETISRTVLIRSTMPLNTIQANPTDLTSTDGKAIVASAIDVVIPADQVAVGEILTATVAINLQDIPSDEYTGELLITHRDGTLVLPLTVRVKHPWYCAFPVLVLGVMFGGGLSYYRQRIQPYDEALVRAGRLRTQMRGDTELEATFRTHIERHLSDTETALQGENVNQAQQALTHAEAVWQRWQRDKANWQEQLHYIEELRTIIEEAKVPTDVAFVLKVRQNLKDAVRDAPAMDQGPSALAKIIQAQRQAIDSYQRLYTQLERLLEETVDVPELKQRAGLLEEHLFTLDPDDTGSLKKLQEDIRALATQVAEHETTRSTREVLDGSRGGRDITAGFTTLPLVPSLVPTSTSINTKSG